MHEALPISHESRPVAARLSIVGDDLGPAYAAFAEERLARYGLSGRVEASATRATIAAEGPAALVDMLEIACLLGPATCCVGASSVAIEETP